MKIPLCFLLASQYLVSLISCGLLAAATPSQWVVDFESSAIGPYTETQLKRDWHLVDWAQGMDRTAILTDAHTQQAHVLEVLYPKGAVGPNEGGAQFVIPLIPQEYYTLSYDFRISEDFDFRLGGKLPGLTSGGSAYTGGHKPDKGQGWSARFMWREGGQMVVYLYYIDMKGKWGDDYPLRMPPLEKGKWYHVKERITLNAPDAGDGRIEVWMDNQAVLDLQHLRLRVGNQGEIDTFYFSTFFGGNTSEWGPHNDCHIRFDNFRVFQE